MGSETHKDNRGKRNCWGNLADKCYLYARKCGLTREAAEKVLREVRGEKKDDRYTR